MMVSGTMKAANGCFEARLAAPPLGRYPTVETRCLARHGFLKQPDGRIIGDIRLCDREGDEIVVRGTTYRLDAAPYSCDAAACSLEGKIMMAQGGGEPLAIFATHLIVEA